MLRLTCYLTLIVLAFCAPVNAADAPVPIMGNQDMDLSPAQLVELESKTEHGDGQAAFRISLYYSLVKNDHKKELYWLNKASNLGLSDAKYSLAYYIVSEKNFNKWDEAKTLLSDADQGAKKMKSTPDTKELLMLISSLRDQMEKEHPLSKESK
jgi:TPR repeat protein